MVTIEEKLNLFSKLVYQDIVKQSEEKLKELEEKNNILIEEYKKELEEKAKKIIKDMDRKIEQKKNEMISRASIEVKQRILTKKQELLDILLKDQRIKAKEFTKTNKYEEYLKNNLKSILKELKDFKGIKITSLPNDKEKIKEFIEHDIKDIDISTNNISYIEGSESMIGGIIVTDEEDTIRYDASIDSLLEDNIPFIMKRMYEELEKVGDKVGE